MIPCLYERKYVCFWYFMYLSKYFCVPVCLYFTCFVANLLSYHNFSTMCGWWSCDLECVQKSFFSLVNVHSCVIRTMWTTNYHAIVYVLNNFNQLLATKVPVCILMSTLYIHDYRVIMGYMGKWAGYLLINHLLSL